jgi:hypothetical protein
MEMLKPIRVRGRAERDELEQVDGELGHRFALRSGVR